MSFVMFFGRDCHARETGVGKTQRSPSWMVFSPPEPHGAGAKKLGSVAKTDGYGTEQYWNLVNPYVSWTKPIVEGPKSIVSTLKRIVAGSARYRKDSLPCRNGSFPYGNESIPHGKIGYRRTQFILHVIAGGHFHVEMTPFHLAMTSSHAGMTRSHIGICPRRLSTSGSYFGPARSDTGTTETRMAARQAQ